MNLSSLNWVDYTFAIVIIVSTLISLIRGLVKEALSLASWIVAFWVGITFAKPAAPLLAKWISNDGIRIVSAFFILFAITLILGTMLNFLISQIVQKTGLSGTDRILGMVFGAGRGVLLVALLVMAGSLTSMPKEQWWKASVFIPHVRPVAMWMQAFMPKKLHFNYGQG